MHNFPNELGDCSSYLKKYFSFLQTIQDQVDNDMFVKACETLEQAYLSGNKVFTCGNGGSAAIANHMVCDHGKLIATNTSVKPKVISLCQPVEMLTAIANDISFDNVFSYQLEALSSPGDILVIISGSGNSSNLCKAIRFAKSNSITTIAMTAFDGGFCRKNADVSLHVNCNNYGIAEDIHQSLMQAMAQFLRAKHLVDIDIKDAKF